MTRAVLDRSKLAGVLGLLGSDADGERAAAGLLATRMLRAAGFTWADLILPPSSGPARPCSARQHQEQFRYPSQPHTFNQQQAAALEICRRWNSHLTIWEMDFLAGIARRRTLSAKQLAVLTQIAADLPRRAGV